VCCVLRRRRGRSALRRILHIHAHVAHAIHLLDRLARLAHQRRRILRGEEDAEAHPSLHGHAHVTDHLGGDDILPRARVDHALQRVSDPRLQRFSHGM
jgi:hypothetical protein